jgi:L-ascorbate 6-phosphate lactonase
MNFLQKLKAVHTEPGQIAITWLGQAGFLIKNFKGDVLALDIYLSDLAERQDGNKRLMPSLIQADELEVKVILATHYHTDHLDLDSIPILLSGDTKLYCCQQSYELCKKKDLPMHKITAMDIGDCVFDSGYRIEAVYAEHGDFATKAIGFLIEIDNIRIYFTGDTSYQINKMRYAAEKEIDILILPINGEYGNMNERDAAMLASIVKAKVTIPCHFWTFARHQGSPYNFQTEMNYIAPDSLEYTMAQGEIIYYPK